MTETDEDAKWRRKVNANRRSGVCLTCKQKVGHRYASFCAACQVNRLLDRERRRAINRKVGHLLKDGTCKLCGADFQAPRSGRPPVYCGEHRDESNRRQYEKEQRDAELR